MGNDFVGKHNFKNVLKLLPLIYRTTIVNKIIYSGNSLP